MRLKMSSRGTEQPKMGSRGTEPQKMGSRSTEPPKDNNEWRSSFGDWNVNAKIVYLCSSSVMRKNANHCDVFIYNMY